MISIQDPGQTLSPAQREQLTTKAAAYPFDIHVLIGTGSGWISASRANFEHEVAAHVKPGSRTVSIGVDPDRRFTFVHSSSALGVPPGPQVAQAGNAFFKRGNLVEGIDAIAAKAQELRVEPRPMPLAAPGAVVHTVSSQTGTPIVIHQEKMSPGFWWGLGGVAAVAAAVLGWMWLAARRRDRELAAARADLEIETQELRSRNIEEQGWHDRLEASMRTKNAAVPAQTPLPKAKYHSPPRSTRVTPAPAPFVPSAPPAPVIVTQPSNNSALELLLAAELMRDSRAPVIEREVIRERRVEADSSSSSWDSSSSSSSSRSSSDSSSSSSWDSSSDSSSSSSFDSGGGSDSSSGSDW